MSTDIWSRRSVFVAALMAAMMAMVVTASTASAEVIDRIVAQVNDEIITLYELEQAAIPYLVQHGQSPAVLEDDARRAELLEEVLDDVVGRLLIEQEAEEMGLEITEAQVEEWMAMTAQQQNMTPQQFQQAIAQYGIDADQYREIVRDNLMQMQLLQIRGRGGAVSESEVDSIYRQRFGSPDGIQRRLEV